MQKLNSRIEKSLREQINPAYRHTPGTRSYELDALIQEIDKLRNGIKMMHLFLVEELSQQYARYLDYEGTQAWEFACQTIMSDGFSLSAVLSADEILNKDKSTQDVDFNGVNDGDRTHDNRNHN